MPKYIYIYTRTHTHTCLFVYFGYSITFPKRLPAVAAIRHAISWKRFRWTHRCWRCCVTCILFLPTAHCHEKWWKTWAKHPLGGEKKSNHPTYGAAPVVKGLKKLQVEASPGYIEQPSTMTSEIRLNRGDVVPLLLCWEACWCGWKPRVHHSKFRIAI